MPPNLLTFSEALASSGDKRHLLLGNGFSIALRPKIFSYGSLFERADFSKVPHAVQIFEALKTRDFEAVIKVLVDAARLLKAYKEASPRLVKQLQEDAAAIKSILVAAIAENHPDRPFDIEAAQYQACRAFLSNFDHIYTLNYDVLLYWALMQDEVDKLDLAPDDGFRHPEDDPDAPYVSWLDAHSPTIHYLHGALHLFDAGAEITKFTWSKTDIPLLEQIRQSLDADRYPLFVSEGDSSSKYEKILHNAYLHKAYRSFKSICEPRNSSLFIFGHSLADNDNHILKRIARGKVSHIYVSLHGSIDGDGNKVIASKAQTMIAERAKKRPRYPLSVSYFDAGSAKVWG